MRLKKLKSIYVWITQHNEGGEITVFPQLLGVVISISQ